MHYKYKLTITCLQLKTTRDAVKFLAVGGILGAVSTGGFAWKYSKSPHGKSK